MSQNDPLAALPTTVEEMAQHVTFSDVDLNRVQSAGVQEMLRKGAVTPEQVTAWRESNGTAVRQVPAAVVVPASPALLGGTTRPHGARLQDVVQRSFEISDAQRAALASEVGNSDTGSVRTIGLSSDGAKITENAG